MSGNTPGKGQTHLRFLWLARFAIQFKHGPALTPLVIRMEVLSPCVASISNVQGFMKLIVDRLPPLLKHHMLVCGTPMMRFRLQSRPNCNPSQSVCKIAANSMRTFEMYGKPNAFKTFKDPWKQFVMPIQTSVNPIQIAIQTVVTSPSGWQNTSALEGLCCGGPLIFDPSLSAELVGDRQKSWPHAHENSCFQSFAFVGVKGGLETQIHPFHFT
jgi:hypothetical protein